MGANKISWAEALERATVETKPYIILVVCGLWNSFYLENQLWEYKGLSRILVNCQLGSYCSCRVEKLVISSENVSLFSCWLVLLSHSVLFFSDLVTMTDPRKAHYLTAHLSFWFSDFSCCVMFTLFLYELVYFYFRLVQGFASRLLYDCI